MGIISPTYPGFQLHRLGWEEVTLQGEAAKVPAAQMELAPLVPLQQGSRLARGARQLCLWQSHNIPNPRHIHIGPVTQVQGKPRGLSKEVPSASKEHPDCALVGTSEPLPSCQWDTSSPWLHFLSASPQVQGREANSQAISIFNADQGCVGAALWDIHAGSAEQAGRAGEAHQPPVNCQW